MDASDFFNTVVKRNYQEFTASSDDYRSLWNAIVSMNTVAEHVALEQHQYNAQVSRQQLDRTANQIRDNDLADLKFCAEALKHVRKIPRTQKQGSVTITVSSTIVSSTDRATWTIDGYDLESVLKLILIVRGDAQGA